MIYLGADHRGYHLKEKIKAWFQQWNLPFEDLGNQELDLKDDYPDFAARVAKKVVQYEREAVGIVICGSGVGVDVVANKFSKIRCGLGFSSQQIRKAVQDDDINILALPADFLSDKKAKKIVEIFLKTEFGQEKDQKRRLKKIKKIEQENFKKQLMFKNF
jgi:RpiB/LacA/LacB family sugar-phosphate isomerase